MFTALTKPFWTATPVPQAEAVRLTRNVQADVCVVGAGIAGLSVALCLLEHGRSVIVLDRYDVGEGETLRTSGHLSSALDDRYVELERLHGEGGARMAAESHRAAIDRIEDWVAKYGIECDFRRVDGYLFRAPESDQRILDEECAAARRAGLDAELCTDGAPGAEHLGPALRFPDQARIHVRHYLLGLAAAVRRSGGRVFGGADVVVVHDGDAFAGVRTREGVEVRAGAVVVATNAPFHRRVAVHTKQAAYRTFVVAGRIPRGEIADALYWDTGDPYRYARCLDGGANADWQYLIVGGEDCRTGQAEEAHRPFEALTAWARMFAPAFSDVEFAWSGQVLEPVDGLAFIGADPGAKRIFVVTGDSGNGLTHGTSRPAAHCINARRGSSLAPAVRPRPQAAQRGMAGGKRERRGSVPRLVVVRQRRVGRPHPRGGRRGGQARYAPVRPLSLGRRRDPRLFGPLAAPRLLGAVERDREELGLSVPWLALCGARRARAQRARAARP
jgi:glycine/D-amino acid oxidase-like deaminating enzyme